MRWAGCSWLIRIGLLWVCWCGCALDGLVRWLCLGSGFKVLFYLFVVFYVFGVYVVRLFTMVG